MLLKKKKKQSTNTMGDHGSLLYRDIDYEDIFDAIEYEIASILLQLSDPDVFSSEAPLPLIWGRTKKRTSSVFLQNMSPPSVEVAEMGSTSSSSCLTGEAKKTIPPSVNKGFQEEFSTTNQRSKLKITSQPNASSSCSVLESEMGWAQVGLLSQTIAEKRGMIIDDDQNLLHLQPLICVGGDRAVSVRDVETPSLEQQARDNLDRRGGFDLNLPAAAEEEANHIVAMFNFQRGGTKAQVAAQARRRRSDLIRSKKRSSRFFSSYQFK